MISIQKINPMELMDIKPDHIGFALAKITTEQFATIENNLEKEEAEVEIKMNFRFAADNENRLIGVFASFTFGSQKNPFIIIEAGCHFAIIPEAWEKMMDAEANKLTVPKDFLQHLVVLTVGTTRGILHAKTENTKFNKYHLPTLNIVDIIKEDSVFEFRENES